MIKVTSKSNSNIFAERAIKVVADTDKTNVPKRVINFRGEPANLNNILQKFVSYKTKDDAMASAEVPETIKQIIIDPKSVPKKEVKHQNGAVWTI